jgi:iron-sulfur cluster assembly protein
MITLTSAAHQQIKQQLAKRGTALGIGIGIKNSGCGGHSYTLEFVDNTNPLDIEIVIDDVKIYVDPYHTTYLRGTTVDYVTSGFQSGFTFDNPNVKAECGCGESFRF